MNPLVLQNIGDALRVLMHITNVFPTVLVFAMPRGVVCADVYMVEAVYPTHVEGRYRPAPGTVCLRRRRDTTVIPVAIPQVRQEGEGMAQLATASTSTNDAAWIPYIKVAADLNLGDDSVASIRFSPFRIPETGKTCGSASRRLRHK